MVLIKIEGCPKGNLEVPDVLLCRESSYICTGIFMKVVSKARVDDEILVLCGVVYGTCTAHFAFVRSMSKKSRP